MNFLRRNVGVPGNLHTMIVHISDAIGSNLMV